jgi:hypothetical protein
MRIVEYFNGPPTRPDDHKCSGNKCSLSGWLYIPKKLTDDRRAVVFLHGHHRERHEPCELAAYFLANHYVFFAPLRSGNVGEDDNKPPAGQQFKNTGAYIDDWAAKRSDDNEDFEAKRVRYLRDFQTHDVDHAIQFLSHQKYTDGGRLVGDRRIGIIGHSYGGALAVFCSGAEFETSPRAIIDISGAELSWDGDGGPWSDSLRAAVRKRKIPIYFLQPRNGLSIRPTVALAYEAGLSGDNEFQAALFLPVIPNTGPEDVHTKFLQNRVAEWGPSVLDFFDRYFH